MPEERADHPVLARALEALEARFPAASRDASPDPRELRLRARREDLPAMLSYLKTSLGFAALNDMIALDHARRDAPGGPAPRFTVLYLVFRFSEAVRVRLAIDVGEGEALDSITPLFRSADWAEREIFDMFGIPFAGHPGLRRIYMPDDFPGHPLRKDHPLGWTERGL